MIGSRLFRSLGSSGSLCVCRAHLQNQDRQAEGGSDLSNITQNKCG